MPQIFLCHAKEDEAQVRREKWKSRVNVAGAIMETSFDAFRGKPNVPVTRGNKESGDDKSWKIPFVFPIREG